MSKPQVENDEFAAFEKDARSTSEYIKSGVLYFINVSKKPEQYEAPSQFTDKTTGKPKMQTNYKVEVLDLSTGQFVSIGVYGTLYLDMIAKRDAFLEYGLSFPMLKGIKLLPYVRVKAK